MAKPSREYIYGINPIFEVVRGGRRTIYQAWLNQSSAKQPRLAKLAAYLEKQEIAIEWVEKGRIFDLAQSKEHQGAVLKTSPYPYVSLSELIGQPRLLMLDNVEDPHNVGAILRSAEIFGFRHVLLPLKGTPEIYPSVVKVSAGATEHMMICKETTANTYFKHAVEAGFTVVALDGGGDTDLEDMRSREMSKMLLVIGGEDRSVGQYILNSAHHVVRIPQRGRINSLNASVAAGIAMYAFSEASR